MKKVLILCIILTLTGCSSSSNYKEYCPVCGESVEYEVEPDDAVKWLEKLGYIVINYDGELQELARKLYRDDPECLADDLLSDDKVIAYLKKEGWRITPPKE